MRGQLLDEHGIEIMAAFGALYGKVWRIGLMGYNARLENALTVLGGAGARADAASGFRVAARGRRRGGAGVRRRTRRPRLGEPSARPYSACDALAAPLPLAGERGQV